MKKRLLAVILSVALCISSMYVFSGCQAKPFTVTFLPGAELNIEDAETLTGNEEVVDTKLYIDGEYVQTVTHVSQLKPPKFARKGYVHQGWNKLLANIKSDSTVEAHWVQRSFEVIFEPGALDATYFLAQNTDIRVKQVVGSGLELKPPAFERPGYNVSWDYKAISFIDDACTVTPQWTPKDFTLSFDDGLYNDFGIYNEYSSLTVTYGDLIKNGQGEIPTPAAHPQSKNFGGWKYVTGENEGDYVFINNDSEWIYPTNATLQALWLAVGQYRIVYKNSFNHANRLFYSANDASFELLEPSRKGYTFVGWTYDGQITPTKEVTISEGSSGNKEFTANWIANDYQIVLNAGIGGTCGEGGPQVKTLEVTYGEKVMGLPTPIRNGFMFVCWISENGTVIENDKVWNYDTSANLSAVYKRIYTIELVTECTVNGVKVVCDIPNSYINKYDLKKSKTEENVYIMENYIEGTRLPELPTAAPTSETDKDEYAFSSWRYEKVKKVAGTILNEVNFPNSIEDGVITLKVSCYALWTPFL